MLTIFRLYREYSRQGLRRAWQLSGMSSLAWQALRVVLLGIALVAACVFLASQAQAVHDAADNRVASKMTSLHGEILELRRIVAACLGEKEGALFIGGELHLCRAVPTGVQK